MHEVNELNYDGDANLKNCMSTFADSVGAFLFSQAPLSCTVNFKSRHLTTNITVDLSLTAEHAFIFFKNRLEVMEERGD